MNKKIYLLCICISLILCACRGTVPEDEKDLQESSSSEEVMPGIKDMVTNGELCITLCEDGSVWGWKAEQGREYAAKYAGLENIVTIKCAGPAMYALSQEGDVYVWGSNELFQIKYESYPGDADKYNQLREQYFDEPVKIEGLADIVEIDVSADRECGKGRLFAVDGNGKLYISGLYLYWDEEEDYKPGFPEENDALVDEVRRVFAGTGSYHYFIREDGTIFSIMDSAQLFRSTNLYIHDFIFPELPIEEHNAAANFTGLPDIPYVDLRKGTKYGVTILYELGEEEGIESIDADRYTMFLSRDDGTLWYWNSGMVKYHDHKYVIAEPDLGENYAGNFCQVNVREVLNIAEDERVPLIADICSGNENVIFLTDDGQAFASSYAACEIKDVEYYNLYSTNPDRERTLVEKDMQLKTLAFEKLDWENIISINTDGEYHFTAVDEEGNYYVLDMAPEEND